MCVTTAQNPWFSFYHLVFSFASLEYNRRGNIGEESIKCIGKWSISRFFVLSKHFPSILFKISHFTFFHFFFRRMFLNFHDFLWFPSVFHQICSKLTHGLVSSSVVRWNSLSANISFCRLILATSLLSTSSLARLICKSAPFLREILFLRCFLCLKVTWIDKDLWENVELDDTDGARSLVTEEQRLWVRRCKNEFCWFSNIFWKKIKKNTRIQKFSNTWFSKKFLFKHFFRISREKNFSGFLTTEFLTKAWKNCQELMKRCE